MSEQPVVVQKISWQDLCPWTIIFKTLPVAASATVLVLALLGVLLTPMGWKLSETLFVRQEHRGDIELMDTVARNNSPYRSVFPTAGGESASLRVLGVPVSGPRLVFEQIIRSFQSMFSRNSTGWRFCYFLFGSVWTVFVWSFLGLAITRVCLLRLTRNELAGLDDAFEFILDNSGGDDGRVANWLSAIGAVGIPMVAIAVLCIPTFLIGLLLGFDVGVLLAGMIWFVVLAIAFAMALLLLGLMFGWPLMISSVAAESQNSFDAMTRAYAYTFQRPLNYLLYGLIAVLFGGFCWLIVSTLTIGVLDLAFWATSWGANLFGGERMEILTGYAPVPSAGNVEQASWSLESGRGLIGWWSGFVKTLAAAFIYGLFWCMSAAIYLLLRRDVDETEMDELFIADEKRSYVLPPLRSDENGIPQVQAVMEADETDAPEDDPLGGQKYTAI